MYAPSSNVHANRRQLFVNLEQLLSFLRLFAVAQLLVRTIGYPTGHKLPGIASQFATQNPGFAMHCPICAAKDV